MRHTCVCVTVYVVLGHYYEHMGLLIALNEMNLLDKGTRLLYRIIIIAAISNVNASLLGNFVSLNMKTKLTKLKEM